MKFVRISYVFRTNFVPISCEPEQIFQNKFLTFALVLVGHSNATTTSSSGFTAHPVQYPLVVFDTGIGLRPHQSKRIWDTSQGRAHQKGNKIQTVLQFVPKKICKVEGGSTPHVAQTAHAGGSSSRQDLHVHIFIYSYVQITSVQVRWDRRSRSQRQSCALPPLYPSRARLQPAQPCELCSIASAKPASIAGAVRRWGGGGGCWPNSSGAAVTRARSGAKCATWTA